MEFEAFEIALIIAITGTVLGLLKLYDPYDELRAWAFQKGPVVHSTYILVIAILSLGFAFNFRYVLQSCASYVLRPVWHKIKATWS
jgi:hypothetical protein